MRLAIFSVQWLSLCPVAAQWQRGVRRNAILSHNEPYLRANTQYRHHQVCLDLKSTYMVM